MIIYSQVVNGSGVKKQKIIQFGRIFVQDKSTIVETNPLPKAPIELDLKSSLSKYFSTENLSKSY